MNHKFAEEHEMILKTHENFSKNKRIINIRDDSFQKICCLSIIKIENDYNLKSCSFKFLKLLTFIFFLLIKFIEFLVIRFNTFLFISIKLIKSFVVPFYAFVWIMKSVKYSNVSELKLIKNQIVFDAVTFSTFVAIFVWCWIVFNNEVIY